MQRTLPLVVCLAAAAAFAEEKGLSAGAVYAADAWTDGRAASMLGNLTAHLQLDLKRLRLFRGQVFASVQGLHGSGVGERLTNAVQCPSNLESDPFRKWGEVWYGDSYSGGKARVRAGRLYADREFGSLETSADFLNAAFGALPTAPMPTYPDPALGIEGWIAPPGRISAGAGVYGGGFGIVEARAQLSTRDTAAAGAWKQGGNRGLYATVEHRFTAGTASPRAVFARWGRAPAGRNDVDFYAGAGGAFGGAGLGVTTVRPVGKRVEVICEFFYKRRLGSRISLQPDAQYVAKPSGRWIGGIRLTIEL
jgi:carbohydrate-selective porin OprB